MPNGDPTLINDRSIPGTLQRNMIGGKLNCFLSTLLGVVINHKTKPKKVLSFCFMIPCRVKDQNLIKAIKSVIYSTGNSRGVGRNLKEGGGTLFSMEISQEHKFGEIQGQN